MGFPYFFSVEIFLTLQYLFQVYMYKEYWSHLLPTAQTATETSPFQRCGSHQARTTKNLAVVNYTMQQTRCAPIGWHTISPSPNSTCPRGRRPIGSKLSTFCTTWPACSPERKEPATWRRLHGHDRWTSGPAERAGPTGSFELRSSWSPPRVRVSPPAYPRLSPLRLPISPPTERRRRTATWSRPLWSPARSPARPIQPVWGSTGPTPRGRGKTPTARSPTGNRRTDASAGRTSGHRCTSATALSSPALKKTRANQSIHKT